MSGELPLTENNRRRPKVVVNVWQNVFIISAIEHGSRGVQRSGDALGKSLIVSPLPKSMALRNVRNTGTAKLPVLTFAKCKGLRHINFASRSEQSAQVSFRVTQQ